MIALPYSFIEKATAAQSEPCIPMFNWVYFNYPQDCLEASNTILFVQIPIAHDDENRSCFIRPEVFRNARSKRLIILTDIVRTFDLGDFPVFEDLKGKCRDLQEQYLILDARALYRLACQETPHYRERPIKIELTEQGLEVNWLKADLLTPYSGAFSFIENQGYMEIGQLISFDVNQFWRVAQAICEGRVGRRKSWLIKLFLGTNCYLVKPFIDVEPLGRQALLMEYTLDPKQMGGKP